jgi:hypothetical protein
MRNQPTHAWEVEAARRREVIESDFGAHHRTKPEVTGSVQTSSLAGPLASWIAGLTRSLQVRSTEPVECVPHGQPGLGAPKPGT